ncbi:DUF3043 domain-containing protein [Thermomonospora cellulosilytica]|uniref:DUF3043 domain-containing protein n=1 Tax=Thermomonospora cellulosilytica TaxID=1411118 RepID=UPI0016026485|nr:DUF3043 domain-containing protein [Thermomonospora cellulosilytica]
MPVFRRRTETAPAERPPQPVKPGGKGRPTPKRSEAQKRRRQYITAPRDRKEAYRRFRERQAQNREKVREGMKKGDERYLLKRDRGPVRKFARDYVDGRRTFGSYLMYAMFVIVLLSFVRTPITALLMLFGPPLLLLVVLLEGFWISSRVKRLTAERFPDEDRKGVGLYAAVRAMQIRRFRVPEPQVRVGERVEARDRG